MSAATGLSARQAPGTTPPAGGGPIVKVSVPRRTVFSELRAIRVVWERELIRFASDRLRIVTSLVQPLLFLFVLGSGLERLASAVVTASD